MAGGEGKFSCTQAALSVLEYDTLKTVHIKSKKVGLIFRILQLVILGYIIGYAIIWQKGYQAADQAVSTVYSKVKGVAVTCNDLNVTSIRNCSDSDIRVWDTADYVIPPQESNAAFIVTNSVQTSNQTQQPGGWPEDPDASTKGSQRAYTCEKNADCEAVRFSPSRNGAVSGKCDLATKRCMVYGWGPVELSKDDDASQVLGYPRQMPQVKNFTMFIKNTIFFPHFQRKFGNTGLGNSSASYLKSCLWNESTDRYCPVFRIEDILSAAGVKSFEQDVMMAGAVITVQIRYDCNLDKNVETCAPEYRFTRIDEPNNTLSNGFNFRFARYAIGEVPSRDLYKVYGLRFVFIVSGTAGKFDFVPLLVTFGSGLGLLSLATIVADLLVTKCLRNAEFYYDRKYEIVNEDEVEGEAINVTIRQKPEEDTPLLH
ncbi:P2X purinoceptor [Salpingoeca rosetta]|uniref:p2X purinoceptor n=1 Tax=Salpingoeca rosetta (strain ATCC 50818 / BSB-021) TaxID=946362 RepID=F2U6L3_SALR5|nr:P2X purinoceptor [Salpingoeca rosetta]EGD83495.1 P2X purinoceptor [Salpingoeca rosetta]|eukprot:XP_004994999.1 P2X purinoceptor [Salpingoeca rosetta]